MKCERCGAEVARDHVRLFFGYEEKPELAVGPMFVKHVNCDACLEAIHDQVKQLMETWEQVNDIPDR